MAGFSASSVALNGNTIDRWVWQEISPGSSQRPATSTTSPSGSPAGGAVATCVTVPPAVSMARGSCRSPVSTSITRALTNQVRADPLPI